MEHKSLTGSIYWLLFNEGGDGMVCGKTQDLCDYGDRVSDERMAVCSSTVSLPI